MRSVRNKRRALSSDRLYGGASHSALVGGEKIRTTTSRAVSKTVNGISNQRSARYKRPAAGSQGNCGETRPASGRIGRSPKRTAAGSASGMKGAKDCGVLSLPDAPLRPAYQMLEAGVRQFTAWGDTDEGQHILIAVARYLAAHSPTERAALQPADIARRLMRGGELHQEAGAS